MTEESPAECALVRRLRSYMEIKPDEAAALMSAARPAVEFEAREELVRSGDSPPLFFVERGWALRYLPMNNGDQQIVQIILPGDIVDGAAFLPEARSVAAVRCATSVTARPFDAAAFRGLMKAHAALVKAFWLGVMLDENMLLEHIARLGRRSSAEALAHLMLELHHRLGRIGAVQDGAMTMPLSQNDIGDLLGITPVHVSRTFTALRQTGLMDMDRPVVRFHDLPRLRRFAGFDPAYLNIMPPPPD